MKGDRGHPVRLRFTKRGPVRFISHRDVARAFERAFRVEELPLAFTEGFAPRPRVSFGLALPLGYESDAEYLDVELTERIDLPTTMAALGEGLPEGISVTGGAFLEPRAGSLQQEVAAVTYRVEIVAREREATLDARNVGAWVTDAMRVGHLEGVRRRKGREVVEDLRPAMRSLAVVGETTRGIDVELEVATHPRAVRPSEVVTALPGRPSGVTHGRALRTHQWIERDGSRLEPLEADTRVPAEVGT